MALHLVRIEQGTYPGTHDRQTAERVATSRRTVRRRTWAEYMTACGHTQNTVRTSLRMPMSRVAQPLPRWTDPLATDPGACGQLARSATVQTSGLGSAYWKSAAHDLVRMATGVRLRPDQRPHDKGSRDRETR